MKFKPKKDLFYGILIWMIPFASLPIIIVNPNMLSSIVVIASIFFAFVIWTSLDYEIKNGLLISRLFLIKSKIKISEINTIWSTKGLESSFAMAINRLKVKTKRGKVIYIAPKEIEKFLLELKKYNDNIHII